jgi:dihydrofolate synthase/folylpolyglutamate synthase
MCTTEDRLQKLYALQTHGIKPGLETTLALLERLGNPERSFAAFHVAGTNGKGSVCAMLDSILRAAGLPVGLYTSPHLVRFNERIRVNGACVTDEELAALFDTIEPIMAAVVAEGRQPTFFEVTTAMAFEHFRRKGAKLVVLETGMGGRLDATNVVTPLVSIVTRIDLDHMQYLGPTLEAIAREKGGILMPGRPAVLGAMPEPAAAELRAIARDRKAPLTDSVASVSVRRVSQSLTGQKLALATAAGDLGTVTLPLLGRHQLENVATVLAALEAVAAASPIRLPPEIVRRGLESVSWPGRLQVLSQEPPTLLDGAHNPDAARVLAAALKELFKKRPIGLVWGMCSDKDSAGFAAAMPDAVNRCWAVPIRSERRRPTAELAALAQRRRWAVTECATVPAALAAAREWALAENGAVCIAGSLFLVGEVLESLGLASE